MIVTRFAAYKIAEHFVGSKGVGSIERFWPLDGKQKRTIPNPAQRKEIFDRYSKKKK